MGTAKCTDSRDGGGGNAGVSWPGSVYGFSLRLLGRSFGIFAERSGGFERGFGAVTAMANVFVGGGR